MNLPYLKVSPHASDRGNLIGVAPDRITLDELLALGHPTSPQKAIRAHCLGCAYDSESEVKKCVLFQCPLWPFRMGKNVFHAQSRHARDRREKLGIEDELINTSKK